MHTKRFNTFFERWVQFRVGATPRLPVSILGDLKFNVVLLREN